MPQMGPMNWIILYILFLLVTLFLFVLVWSFLNVPVFRKKKVKYLINYINKW